jgi:hypothetical protein
MICQPCCLQEDVSEGCFKIIGCIHACGSLEVQAKLQLQVAAAPVPNGLPGAAAGAQSSAHSVCVAELAAHNGQHLVLQEIGRQYRQ